MEVTDGAGTVYAAVGAGHALQIAAIELALCGGLHCFAAVVQTCGIMRTAHLAAHSSDCILHGGGYSGCQREAEA